VGIREHRGHEKEHSEALRGAQVQAVIGRCATRAVADCDPMRAARVRLDALACSWGALRWPRMAADDPCRTGLGSRCSGSTAHARAASRAVARIRAPGWAVVECIRDRRALADGWRCSAG
jgi:hypothetical protein